MAFSAGAAGITALTKALSKLAVPKTAKALQRGFESMERTFTNPAFEKGMSFLDSALQGFSPISAALQAITTNMTNAILPASIELAQSLLEKATDPNTETLIGNIGVLVSNIITALREWAVSDTAENVMKIAGTIGELIGLLLELNTTVNNLFGPFRELMDKLIGVSSPLEMINDLLQAFNDNLDQIMGNSNDLGDVYGPGENATWWENFVWWLRTGRFGGEPLI